MSPMSESQPVHDDEVSRMKNEFSAMLSKWGDIQQQLVETLETASTAAQTPRPPLSTLEIEPIITPTQFIRHRMTRSATPPPTTTRMGERSMSHRTDRTDRASLMLSEDDDDDEKEVRDEKDLQIAQQRETIADLKEKIAALEKEKHDLILQNTAEKDAMLRETNSSVAQMSASLGALQRDMKGHQSDQSVTRQHLEKHLEKHLEQLTTNQSEERRRLCEWLSRQDDIAKLKQQNEYKDVIISETNAELQQMAAAMATMQQKMKARAAAEGRRSTARQGMLTKVQGQSMENLRLGRKSRKHVFFAGNRLFWSDDKSGKSNGASTYKSIEVREVLNRVVVTAEKLRKINNEAIQKHAQRPWFLVVGQRRCALFEAESQVERDAWVKFMRRALRQNMA